MPILTSQEKAAVEELRLRMKNELSLEKLDDENMFYRFLKARDFELDLAETMLRKNLAWRRAHQVDTILIDYSPLEVMKKYFSYNKLGYDKDGRPVVYLSMGNMHYEGIFKSIKDTELYRYLLYILEERVLALKKQSELLRKEIDQFVIIFDFTNLTFTKAVHKKNLRNLITFISLTNANYPERLKILYFINVPVFFKIAYASVKPVIPAIVLRKIKVFGLDGWKEELLKVIDADTLPAFLGGRRTDPDGNPFCNTFIIHGDPVPERYHLCNSRTPMYKRADARELLIPALSKEQVEINIDQYDRALEWEYETKHGGIGFGLFYRGNCSETSNEEELIPIQKVYSCDGSETGIFRCEKLGIYNLVFDNSYSYFYQKELYYKIVIKNLLGI